MVAIAMVRGITIGVVGTEDLTWVAFWVQLEASISIIAACPTAFRTLFLVNRSTKKNPEKDIEGQRSALARLWKRTKPTLESIMVGTTLTGLETAIRDNGSTQLGSKDDEESAVSSAPTQVLHTSTSLEAPERRAEMLHEQVQVALAMV